MRCYITTRSSSRPMLDWVNYCLCWWHWPNQWSWHMTHQPIVKATFSLELSLPEDEMKVCDNFKSILLNKNIWFVTKFLLNGIPYGLLMLNHHWFRLWLGTYQVPSHYLNQWCHWFLSYVTFMCHWPLGEVILEIWFSESLCRIAACVPIVKLLSIAIDH